MTKPFDVLEIGSLAARNRIVRAATHESLADLSGRPSQRLIELYRDLAEGGSGIIVTGYAFTCEEGRPSKRALGLHSDLFAVDYRALISAVHEQGGKIVAQLVYGGSKSVLEPGDERFLPSDGICDAAAGGNGPAPNVRILGPSSVAHPATGLVPMSARADDLKRIRDSFVKAAARARRFGFDGVEVHAAHGYLLSQFLSPEFNKRTDEYGGSIANRVRLACECVSAMRNVLGAQYPILVKLNSSDDRSRNAGLTGADSRKAAAALERAGASAIEVSGDWHAFNALDASQGPFFGAHSARLADELSIPVIVTGGWRNFDDVERYLDETGIAAIGMARPLICEPHLPRRWSEGDTRSARCTSCNFCASHMGIPRIYHKSR